MIESKNVISINRGPLIEEFQWSVMDGLIRYISELRKDQGSADNPSPIKLLKGIEDALSETKKTLVWLHDQKPV